MYRTIIAFLAAFILPACVLIGLAYYGFAHYTKSLPDSQKLTFLFFIGIILATPLLQLIMFFKYRKQDEEIAAGILYAFLFEAFLFCIAFIKFCS
jgi:heme/copper-type cytochrome/quinol oxidase subunit 4